jgi:hypothetical protein
MIESGKDNQHVGDRSSLNKCRHASGRQVIFLIVGGLMINGIRDKNIRLGRYYNQLLKI